MPLSNLRRFALVFAAALTSSAALLTTGCGIGPTLGSSGPATVAGTALHGSIYGGQQAVVGSKVYLFAAGTSGYSGAATSLLTSATGNPADGSGRFYALSGSDGGFSITGAYTCPTNSLVYLVALGGNSGFGSGNPNLAMMAALGSCSGSLSASQFISINEVTTIGSVYAMARFMSGPANVGTSSTNIAGLANAFSDVPVLVNTATGATPGPSAPTGSVIPTTELNTLADILAACINSSGGTASDTSTNCGKLFSATNYGTAPTDTITAAVNIARNPTSNIGALYSLVNATAPFQPTLSTQPADFTVSATFVAPAGASSLAADASGNVWITGKTLNNALQLSHTGSIATTSTAVLNSPSAISLDATGAPWITNSGNNSVTRLNTAGAVTNTYTGGGLNLPRSISFDSNGTAWIANASSVTSITSAGTATNYTPVAATAPVAIAVTPH